MIAYVLTLYVQAQVPAMLSVPTWAAAVRHDIDPIVLGAYLISEHRGDYPLDRCSDAGACGPFQLQAMWRRHFGHEPGARREPWAAADIAARVVVYSVERHTGCDADHDWRAHMKCSPAGRDECDAPVRRWLRAEDALRGVLEAGGDDV